MIFWNECDSQSMSLKITSLNFVTAYLAANNKKLAKQSIAFKIRNY